MLQPSRVKSGSTSLRKDGAWRSVLAGGVCDQPLEASAAKANRPRSTFNLMNTSGRNEVEARETQAGMQAGMSAGRIWFQGYAVSRRRASTKSAACGLARR